MAGFRGLFSRVFLISLIVSVFWVACVGAEVIVADITEADLEGYVGWAWFLDNCEEGGTAYSASVYFDSILVHLEVDTDKETVTGTLSGSGSSDSKYAYLYTEEHSFVGTISGSAKRVYWGGYLWEWVFEADVELDLTFSMSHRCKDDSTGEYYWISKEETIHVTKMLRALTASNNNQQFMHFDISWKDFDEQPDTPIRFSMSARSRALPLEMPDPIDVDVTISGPEQIGRGDSGATFDMTTKGKDIDKVQNVCWYFYYFDEGWDNYRWFESFEKDTLSDLTVGASKIEEWMEYLDNYGTTVDGVKVLPMQFYVELEADEFEWIAVSPRHNFTLSSAHSTRFTLDVSDVIDIYPTGKNVTYFELDHSGTMLNKPVTFEIEGNTPPYLSIELEKNTDPDISGDLIGNRITIELDTSKLGGATLPTEHKITLKAKSSTSENPVEDTKEITLRVKPVKWLILHYIASDTHPPLQNADEQNIQEIITAFQETKNPQIGYNLLIDLQKDWNNPPNMKDNSKLARMKTHLLKIYDNQLKLIESKDTLDMSKGPTLTSFIEKAKENTPSENLILIITDHGKGVNGVVLDHHLGIKDATIMSISDLDKALEGHHVELLILEACLMGKIEVLYELRDKADYIISSQLNMAATSFAYKEAISPLLQNPSLNSIDTGKSFITTFSAPIDYTISLIDTSKLDTVIQEVSGLASALNKGFTGSTETRNALVTVFDVSTCDLKCLAENLLKYEPLKDSDIKAAAEKVKSAVDSAVIFHRTTINGGQVFFKEGIRGFVLDDDGDGVHTIMDGSKELGSYEYYGMDITRNRFLLTKEFTEKYVMFEFSMKTSWLNVLKNIVSVHKSRIELRKNQEGNNLYLRTLDPEGYVNGFDPDSDYKNRIVLEYVQAEYYSYLNGTEVILLPPEAMEFTTHVWGGYMEEVEESYTLIYRLIVDGVVVAEQTLENPITEYTEHSIPISFSENEISIGETTITQLEIPQIETETDTDDQESDSGSRGWIPSFSLTSMILGVSLLLLLYRKRM